MRRFVVFTGSVLNTEKIISILDQDVKHADSERSAERSLPLYAGVRTWWLVEITGE